MREGDTFTITATVSNHTKKISSAELKLTIGTGASKIERTTRLSLDVLDRVGYDFSLKVQDAWKEKVPYTLELRENEKILDSVTRTIMLPPLPIVTQKVRLVEVFTGKTYTLTLPKSLLSDLSPKDSKVKVSISPNFSDHIEKGISSLLQYPYGCIEQTIASTLPNRIASSLSDVLGLTIDTKRAAEYTKK